MRRLPTLALLLAAAFAAAAEEPQYRLKEEVPGTGTRIPKEVVSWNLPINKTYAEFTPEERARLHSYYPGLKPGDEPPYPARGMKPVLREIAELQRGAQELGEAHYGVRVDASGRAQALAVYKSPSERFTKAIAYYLVNTDYKPARCDGQPCAGEYIFKFDFKLGH